MSVGFDLSKGEQRPNEKSVSDRRHHGSGQNHGVPYIETKIRPLCFLGRRLVLGHAALSGDSGNQENCNGEYHFSPEQFSSLSRI